jgi:hypothetical protein
MLQAATAADATASTIVSTSSTETNFFIDNSLPQRHIDCWQTVPRGDASVNPWSA